MPMTVQIMSALLIIGLIVTGYTTVSILMDPHDNALREFAVLGLFCSILIMISYYTELNTPGFAAKVDAVKFGYIGRVFVNPMLLMLIFRYYGKKVGRIWQILLYVIPVITLIAVFRCDISRAYYANIMLSPAGLLLIEPGPVYYLYMSYNIVLALVYLTFCLYQRAELTDRDRVNNTILITACLAPLLLLMMYLSGWTNGYDVSSLGVMLSAMLIALSVFRYGLLNKEEMLDNMATGLVFLDSDAKLVYANKKAEQIIPALTLPAIRTRTQDLSQLCEPEFIAIRAGSATYERRITQWRSEEGSHGKLLTFNDITEIHERLSSDAMTGLYNHAAFYPKLHEALSEQADSKQPVTVAIADIDSFKQINDTYGHANGDTVLISLAETLHRICGEYGSVFRYGGEEFAVIFRGDFALAERVMEQAHTAFTKTAFPFLQKAVTFSFGCAEFNGTESAETLFNRADQLMYTRKKKRHAAKKASSAAMQP